MINLSITIPAHNEELRIGQTLESYGTFFQKLKKEKKLNFEIIVVLNACKDNTLDVVKRAKEYTPEIKIMDLNIAAKGLAIIEGFKDALKRDNDFIGFVDADMATPPEAFYSLLENIKENDGIIPIRWRKDSIVKERKSLIRKTYSAVFNVLVRALLGLKHKDTQCGAKLFKRAAILKVVPQLGITKWAFDIDLLYKMKINNFKIGECSTIWEDKAGSKVNFIAPIQMFSALVRLRILNSPFNFIIKAYDGLPEKIKVHNWKR